MADTEIPGWMPDYSSPAPRRPRPIASPFGIMPGFNVVDPATAPLTINVTPALLEALASEIAHYDGDATLIAHCVLERLSREMRPILLIHFSAE